LIDLNGMTVRIEYSVRVEHCGRRLVDGIEAIDFAEADGVADPRPHKEATPIADPRRMTLAQIRRLGMPHLVDLRHGMFDGRPTYGLRPLTALQSQ
jgi:hypothetical protein